MTLNEFLDRLNNNETIDFTDTMAVIADHYDYQPTEFSNGLGDDKLVNEAGSNEGSCKIFAFAKLHDLDQRKTLQLFGDYYRKDVLQDPDGTGHQNIRNFIRYGWEGIRFAGPALTEK
ncbi:HopJ type III effector protein [Methylomarinum sp. Ch1-1]|uniref:HopJ type III effector protein n=1 Tax=Methylomarinum roseum TaxID=3067653 RepID=A0AAU7NZY4_9GAMM|nr:HopJ type III effector protein [Methylomarinum sp. Ch1-1]MDP4521362.1 HopJ type III effector protein [Methylomarinum sp. Ch1-1]